MKFTRLNPLQKLSGLLVSPGLEPAQKNIAEQARHFYKLARETLPPEDRRSMIAAELMGAVYGKLLKKLERRQFNVLGAQPIRLRKSQKLFLIFRTWLRLV